MEINLPENVRLVLSTLHNNGFTVSVVGGCVRDSILGREPNDWDVATSALPEQVMEMFKGYEVIPTGIQHGTVTVVVYNQPIEVTTYRLDGNYSDGRRPDSVTYAVSIEDDLMRRDFTMNSIAYNPWQGFIDPYNGIEDIRNGIIRCMGKPQNRFNEDGLRVLRALRFAAQLGFEIEEGTSAAIHELKHLLDNISKERIQSELTKMLMSDNCGNQVLDEYRDVLFQIIPEMKYMDGFKQEDHYYKYEDVFKHTLYCMGAYYINSQFDKDKEWNDIILRLALLLHDIGKPHCHSIDEYGVQSFKGHADVSAKMTYKILKDLKFSNEIVAYTTQLVSYHEFNFDSDVHPKVAVKELLNKIGETQLRRLITLQKCDLVGQYLYLTDNRRSCFVQMAKDCLDEVIGNDECYSLKQLAVNGDDLIAAGVPQGKEVGIVLNSLLGMVTNDVIENNREILLQHVNKISKMYKSNNK